MPINITKIYAFCGIIDQLFPLMNHYKTQMSKLQIMYPLEGQEVTPKWPLVPMLSYFLRLFFYNCLKTFVFYKSVSPVIDVSGDFDRTVVQTVADISISCSQKRGELDFDHLQHPSSLLVFLCREKLSIRFVFFSVK